MHTHPRRHSGRSAAKSRDPGATARRLPTLRRRTQAPRPFPPGPGSTVRCAVLRPG
ncbi:hypothetical protein [Caulobacter sp. D4A]|uniref:hypothetical protein n=1 Tax=unclassified Caulobacter TaxID=2648921 RepID=UPI00351A79EF